MSMINVIKNKEFQRGFTLVEVIIFIVVAGIALVGILLVSQISVKSSADPMVHKQAMALADSILEEVLQKEYCDPDSANLTVTPHACAARTAADQEATRDTLDDVDDFNGKDKTLFTDWPTSLAAYNVAITVTPTTLGTNTIPVKQISVQITGGGETFTATGYRANY